MASVTLSQSGLKSHYKVTSKLEPVYTGGKVVLSNNGKFILCALTNDLLLVSLSSGRTIKRLSGDTNVITSFALHPDDTEVVVAYRDNTVIHWDLRAAAHKRVWKAHQMPIIDMEFDSTGTFLATGSSDQTVKIWDVRKGHITHDFRGHSGVVSQVRFHPDPEKLLVVSASDDCTIRVWDLREPKKVRVLSSHVGLVTGLAFGQQNPNILYSVGRDKVLNVWDLATNKLLRNVLVHEELNSVCVLSSAKDMPSEVLKQINKQHNNKGVDLVVVVGVAGVPRIWALNQTGVGECVWTESRHESLVGGEKAKEDTVELELVMSNNTTGQFLTVSNEKNMFLYSRSSLTQVKTIIGYLDEVLDIRYDRLSENKRVILATNSASLVVVDLSNMSASLLHGHGEVVMSLDTSHDGSLLISASKDNDVRLWDMASLKCVAVCAGHTDAVGALVWAKKSNNFFVSGANDRTIKLWDTAGSRARTPKSTYTVLAHEKDINAIAVAPNDKIIATGSQDRTIKLWNAADLSPMGTLKGHRRGVWHLDFSPVDQCIASASADFTIRIWSLKDKTCIKTLEGHVASVLRLSFISSGMQILSSGGDGLIKIWNLKTSECAATFDDHDGKVWGLATSNDATQLVTGGADSTLMVWEDYSEKQQEEDIMVREKKILDKQKLDNFMSKKNYFKAFLMAMSLGHSETVLNILTTVIDTEGQEAMMKLIRKMTAEHIGKSLRYIRDWNTLGKFSTVAQKFLYGILRTYSPAKLQEMSPREFDMKEILQALIPYTDKHFQRFDRLIQQSYIIDLTLSSMTNHVSGFLRQKGEDEAEEIPTTINGVEKQQPTTATAEILVEPEDDDDDDVIIKEESEDDEFGPIKIKNEDGEDEGEGGVVDMRGSGDLRSGDALDFADDDDDVTATNGDVVTQQIEEKPKSKKQATTPKSGKKQQKSKSPKVKRESDAGEQPHKKRKK